MTTPGKFLVDLAKKIEVDLEACGRDVGCVDLAFGNPISPPSILGDCRLRVDVGPDQNPFRAIDLSKNGALLYNVGDPSCSRGWRFNGVVRVTGSYGEFMYDCCHEQSEFVYEFTNTLMIVSETVQQWLVDTPGGESTQTQYTQAIIGGSVTANINFSMRICVPDCEELMVEEPRMLGELRGLKR